MVIGQVGQVQMGVFLYKKPDSNCVVIPVIIPLFVVFPDIDIIFEFVYF